MGVIKIVSDALMDEYLAAMSEDVPMSMEDICKKLDRTESNARKVLGALIKYNLIKRVSIFRNGAGKKPITVAWVKVIK